MPDFDTRRPQEPDRPSRMHMFVVASRRHISALGRLRDRIMVRHRWARNLVRHRWGLGFGVVLPVVIAVFIFWPEQTPTDQLDQKIKPHLTPNYIRKGEGCALSEFGYSASCFIVLTASKSISTELGTTPGDETAEQQYAAQNLRMVAAVTEEIVGPTFGKVGSSSDVVRISFGEIAYQSQAPYATSYCFKSKHVAVTALRGLLDDAKLLGKTNSCYVAVYEGYGPSLNP